MLFFVGGFCLWEFVVCSRVFVSFCLLFARRCCFLRGFISPTLGALAPSLSSIFLSFRIFFLLRTLPLSFMNFFIYYYIIMLFASNTLLSVAYYCLSYCASHFDYCYAIISSSAVFFPPKGIPLFLRSRNSVSSI